MDYPVIDMKGTGERLNGLRKERGITVEELRIYMGMNHANSIYRWFRGEALPTLENMYALAMILGVSMDEIVGRKQKA